MIKGMTKEPPETPAIFAKVSKKKIATIPPISYPRRGWNIGL